MQTEFTKSEGSENKFNFVFSSADVDRHGDIVIQNWDLGPFKKNPVFLDSHNYGSIEHILGKIDKTRVKDGKLQGVVEYALDNPKGLLAYKMTLGGFLNATSVGFIPKDFDEKGRISKSELLEVSAVSVPANPHALLEKMEKGMEFDEAKEKCEACEAKEEEVEEPVEETIEEPTEEPQEEPEVPVEEVEEEVEPEVEEKIAKPTLLSVVKDYKSELDANEARRARLYKEAKEIIESALVARNKGRASHKNDINKVIKRLLKAKEL